ncbi:MFS transporter [Patescibacteria group bacterium]|nr:MFS transporter [Patescibacteria group bacterium]
MRLFYVLQWYDGDVDKNKKIFGLQRNVFFLGITSFLNDLSSEMVLSVLPAFFISVLKTGAGALGIVEGVADAASNLIKVYSGRRSDKMAKRKIFAILGYTLSVCTRPFYTFAGSVFDVASLRVIDRIGKGFRDSPRDALISLSVDAREVGWSFGYHRAMDTLGGVAGPLVAFLILSQFPDAFSSVFMVSFVIGLLAIASLIWVHDVGPVISKNIFAPTTGTLTPRLRAYIFSLFILCAGTLPVAVLLFKTQELGFAVATIPLFYMIYSVSYAISSWPAGRLVDRIGSGRMIVLGYIFLISAYATLAMSQSIFLLVLGLLLTGLFSACADGAQRAHIAHLVPENQRGTAYGYFNVAVGFGALVAGVVGGYLWEFVGSHVALGAGVATVFIGLSVFMSTLRVRRRT